MTTTDKQLINAADRMRRDQIREGGAAWDLMMERASEDREQGRVDWLEKHHANAVRDMDNSQRELIRIASERGDDYGI